MQLIHKEISKCKSNGNEYISANEMLNGILDSANKIGLRTEV